MRLGRAVCRGIGKWINTYAAVSMDDYPSSLLDLAPNTSIPTVSVPALQTVWRHLIARACSAEREMECGVVLQLA